MTNELCLWIGFNTFVLAMLALDLGVFPRKSHVVSVREVMAWTVARVTLEMVFFALAGDMLLAHTAYKIDTLLSLGVIVCTLATAVVMSLLRPKGTVIPVIAPKTLGRQ